MYLLTITTDSYTIKKEAKDEKEFWRLINIYSPGTQEQKKKFFETQLKKAETLQAKKDKIANTKLKEDEFM